jgi:DNA-binding winged helix-turn-helix (wHTH) protein/Tol biopolymer transport system component
MYVFEGFRLDAQRRVLSGPDGQPISLTPRVFDALLYFVERPGQLLTKDHLLENLWQNVVVEEHNLNKTVSELRRLLGEKPGEHKFIVTKPGRGYRFVADVSIETVGTQRELGLGEAAGGISSPPAAVRRGRYFFEMATLLVVLALAAGLALVGMRAFAPRDPQLSFTVWSGAKGGHRGLAWSPDSRQTAYVARSSISEPAELYVREIGSAAPRRIGTLVHAGLASVAQWTTEDRILYWDEGGLWSVSQVGGPPTRVRSIDFDLDLYGFNPERVMDVTRDGKTIVSFGRMEDGRFGVFTVSLPNGDPEWYPPDLFATRQFANTPFLRFSPDDRHLLVWWNAGTGEEAWLLPFPADASQPPRRVLEDLPAVFGTPEFTWLPDNRHIVVSAGPETRKAGPRALFIADTRSGRFSLLSSATSARRAPVVSPSGNEFVFADLEADFDVVTLDLRSLVVTGVVDSLRWEQMPAWAASSPMPMLVYVTAPNNAPEIWLQQPLQPDRALVTARDFATNTTALLAPALSPKGTHVIYQRLEGPNTASSRLWISAVAGGVPEQLTNDVVAETAGAWSPDGLWYVYVATDAGVAALKKAVTSGRAEPQTLIADLKNGSPWLPVWSPDGKWIFVPHQGMLLAADGTDRRELGLQGAGCAFAAREPLLYCIDATPIGNRHALVTRDFDGNLVETLGSLSLELLPRASFNPGLRLSLTPDGAGLSYSIGAFTQSLWLVEGLDDVALP